MSILPLHKEVQEFLHKRGLEKKTATFLIILLGALLFSAVPLTADAGIVQCGTPTTSPCGFCDIFKLITGIINFFLLPPPAGFGVVPAIATLLILVGGFYILIAAGQPERQKTGKDIITAVVIGLLVVYIAWVVVNSILTFLGIATWTGLIDNPGTTDVVEGWWQIQCNQSQ